MKNLWCRRVTRLLSMIWIYVYKNSLYKHKHSQNRQDDGISPFRVNHQQPVAGGWESVCVYVGGEGGGWHPLRASRLRTVSNPLGIFSALLGNKTKSAWSNFILWLILWYFDLLYWPYVGKLLSAAVLTIENVVPWVMCGVFQLVYNLYFCPTVYPLWP